jgi:endonuclease YncB( thermonuclease family)
MIKRRTLLLMLLLLSGSAMAEDLVGQASVVDGDTREIHGSRIRLWGIDSPESSQLCRGEDSSQYLCGVQAANDLDAFIARRPVNCSPINLDAWPDGCDLFGRRHRSRRMACAQGLGARLASILERRYDGAQRDAECGGRGIWKGSYVEPWLYRACIRVSGKRSYCSDDASAHP